MSTVYVINVGANGAHSSAARSPRFADGSFVFVPFPWNGDRIRQYPNECKPFIRTASLTHDDPDWPNLTYGDDCANSRAGNLQLVSEGDILLFWGLLWDNNQTDWSGFTGQKGWYLFGALRVCQILIGGQRWRRARPENVARARRNVHFNDGPLPIGHRVFIGEPRYSALFSRAVDLQGDRRDGLVYRSMRNKHGNPLVLNDRAPFYSYLRTCRPMWNLRVTQDRRLACIVRNRILQTNEYDLFAGIRF
jgi:hypothetical protein